MTPILSIVTTVYNCEQFIEESLDSICKQNIYDEFEWLILSDGPIDSTWEKIEALKYDLKGRVIKIPTTTNIKIPRRRNQAISIASGKYIAIHDGDDISLPERLQTQIDFLESRPNIFCVGGHAMKIDTENNLLGCMDYPEDNHERIVWQIFRNKQNPMIDPTTMFRRQDFISLGMYSLRSEIYTVPDFDLWCRAIVEGKKMANIKKPLIRYRINPNSMTVQYKSEMITAHMIVWREFFDKYRSQHQWVQKEINNE